MRGFSHNPDGSVTFCITVTVYFFEYFSPMSDYGDSNFCAVTGWRNCHISSCRFPALFTVAAAKYRFVSMETDPGTAPFLHWHGLGRIFQYLGGHSFRLVLLASGA